MQVFISWSGEASKFIAENLKNWLENVLQSLEPWLSVDITKGSRWNIEISEKLEKSRVGIICLTRENLNEKWILFEAGALSKTKDAHVCTLLYELEPTDIEFPLAQFQHTKSTKEDVFKLLKTINEILSKNNEKSLKDQNLEEIFEKFWPDLDNIFIEVKSKLSSEQKPKRSEIEVLNELLSLSRNQSTKIEKILTNQLIQTRSQLINPNVNQVSPNSLLGLMLASSSWGEKWSELARKIPNKENENPETDRSDLKDIEGSK